MPAAIDAIEIEQVSKRYGRHRALAGVDLSLKRGRLCALLGPNGAGKSTMLGVVSTLIRPTGGEVVYRAGDTAVGAGERLRRQIGVLAHESFIYSQLTGRENLHFWGRLYGIDDRERRAEQLLEQVGLDERARDRPAQTYSRGMLQRLALARVLLPRPTVLLLDEPFTGLDRKGAAALQAALDEAKQSGSIVLVVTHDLEAIAAHADHVVVLRRGKKVHEVEREGGFAYRELQDLYMEYSE